jgi:hypothetical protein
METKTKLEAALDELIAGKSTEEMPRASSSNITRTGWPGPDGAACAVIYSWTRSGNFF